MQHIYQVLNSYHLLEGLDSEFLIIAQNSDEAKANCLKLLSEDQDSHIEVIKDNIEALKKAINKDWGFKDENDPAIAFVKRANERNLENIAHFTKLLEEFHGYKSECLTARRINSRLKDGRIQFED